MESPDTVANLPPRWWVGLRPRRKALLGQGRQLRRRERAGPDQHVRQDPAIQSRRQHTVGQPRVAGFSLPQIYAYGLRNPFRLNFTPTGQLLVADVGNLLFDELNNVVAGGNYGWPGSEAALAPAIRHGSDQSDHTPTRGSGSAISSVRARLRWRAVPAVSEQGLHRRRGPGLDQAVDLQPDVRRAVPPQDFDLQAGSTVVPGQGPGTDGGIYQPTWRAQPGDAGTHLAGRQRAARSGVGGVDDGSRGNR